MGGLRGKSGCEWVVEVGWMDGWGGIDGIGPALVGMTLVFNQPPRSGIAKMDVVLGGGPNSAVMREMSRSLCVQQRCRRS